MSDLLHGELQIAYRRGRNRTRQGNKESEHRYGVQLSKDILRNTSDIRILSADKSTCNYIKLGV